MVFIPNLNQSPSQIHEIVCPVNAMQETGHGNATNAVSAKKISIEIEQPKGELLLAVLDILWR